MGMGKCPMCNGRKTTLIKIEKKGIMTGCTQCNGWGKMDVPIKINCPKCNKGFIKSDQKGLLTECPECEGSGKIITLRNRVCSKCKGKGEIGIGLGIGIHTIKCSYCHGKGEVEEANTDFGE